MHAYKVLEFGTIRRQLEELCETAVAAALTHELAPSFDSDEVRSLLESTKEALEVFGREHVPNLRHGRDIRNALRRASKGGVLGGLELYHALELIALSRQLKDLLGTRDSSYPRLHALAEPLPVLSQLERKLSDSLDTDGSLRDDASPELSALRRKKAAGVARIQERIQSYISGRSRELLSDPVYTVRDGRYVLPLKAENRGKIRGIVHDTSATGQTIFIEPEDVLQLGNQLREIESAERIEEHRILTALSGELGEHAGELTLAIELIGQIDLSFAKARLAIGMRAQLPIIETRVKPWIKVERGFHPLLDRESAIPLDIEVGQGASVLITGPNTGGKTVAIKCVGLFVLMAQCGLALPAGSVRLAPFRQIWADIGDEQSLEQSLSTFSGHIKNIADSLRWMKPGALILLDEVGAGTDPAEGAALAVGILREMHERGGTILASTHYGELKAFAFNHDGFQNAAMEFDQKSLRPTYRLLLGSPGASQALRIAERYGIPKDVVERAREELGTQAQDIARMLEELERAQKLARQAQSEADKRTEELRRAEDRAKRKLDEADEIRRTAHSKANEVIEAALREIRLDAQRLFEDLKNSPRDGKTEQMVRTGLKELDRVGKDFAAEFLPERRSEPKEPLAGSIVKGSSVIVDGYTQAGVVVEDPKGGKAIVQIGAMKITLPVGRLRLAERPVSAPRKSVTLQKAATATTELHLRHLRAEDATEELERFVDDAVLGNVPSVRIVHGKGGGVLRKITHEYLRKHPHVGSYRLGDATEGGDGVTIAYLA